MYSIKGAASARSSVPMEVRCADLVAFSAYKKKIFLCSRFCMQHCEKHDINFHNQNINIISVYNLFFISIQPHLLATPCQKVIALVMV